MSVDFLPLAVDFGSLGVDFGIPCELLLGIWEPIWDPLRVNFNLEVRGEFRFTEF